MTVPYKDISKYPEYKVVEVFQDQKEEFICERSNMLMEKCEDTVCARLKTHKTRPRVTSTKMAKLCKTETTIVP